MTCTALAWCAAAEQVGCFDVWQPTQVALENGTAAVLINQCLLPMPQVLYELLTWRLPWSFTNMTAYQVGQRLHLPRAFCSEHPQQLRMRTSVLAGSLSAQVGSTIVAGVRPEVPARKALPGPDTAGWAGLDAYMQLMR